MSPVARLAGRVRSLQQSRLLRTTALVAGLGLLVKAMAYLKDILVAGRMGVGPELDAFTLAFSLVSFPMGLLVGNMGPAFQPTFVRFLAQGEEAGARALRRVVLGRLCLVLALLSALGALSAPLWLPRLVPTWQEAQIGTLQGAFWTLLPMLPVMAATSLLGQSLQGRERFTGYSLAPAITSVVLVAFLLAPDGARAIVLARGMLAGAVLECLYLAWLVRRAEPGILPRVPVPEGAATVLRQYLPSLGAGLFMSSTTLVDMLVTSWLPRGGLGVLAYANKLPQILLLLSATALGTTVFPQFSQMAARGDWTGLRDRAARVIRTAMVGGALAAVLFVVLTPFLVRVLYQRGAFGPEAAFQVASVQAVYFLQVPFYIGAVLSVRLLQAMQLHRINLWNAMINATLNFGLDLLLLRVLGLRGIALSTVAVYAASFLFLSWATRRALDRRIRACPEVQP